MRAAIVQQAASMHSRMHAMAVHLQAHPLLCWQMHVPTAVPVLARQVDQCSATPAGHTYRAHCRAVTMS